MNITKRKSKNGILLVLSGELTIYEARNALVKVESIQNIYTSNVDLDVSGLTECDTAGIQILMQLRRKLGNKYVIKLVSSRFGLAM